MEAIWISSSAHAASGVANHRFPNLLHSGSRAFNEINMRHSTSTLLRSILLIVLAATPLVAQDPEEVVDNADRLFVAIRKSQREIPQGTLQNWVRVQEAFAALDSVVRNHGADRDLVWRARYVRGFGLQVLELYDLAADIQEGLLADAPDGKQLLMAEADLANTYEKMGEYGRASDLRLRMLKRAGRGSTIAYNNLALALLKAGRYDEVIHYVGLIDIDEDDVAHTRIFSARAHAYSGRYDSAAVDLALSCSHGEADACAMKKDLAAFASAEQYWARDRAERLALWRPDNIIDSAHRLRDMLVKGTEPSGTAGISRFALSSWFDEIFGLYPRIDSNDYTPAYPASLPPGSLGFTLVGNSPFLTFRFQSTLAHDEIVRRVAAYRAAMHGPSAWDKAMPVANRILLVREKDFYDAIVVHTDQQERMIRELGEGQIEMIR